MQTVGASSKVTAAALAGALTTIAVAVAEALDANIEPEVAAAVATVLAVVFGYFAPADVTHDPDEEPFEDDEVVEVDGVFER